MGLWALPEGVGAVSKVRKSDPARGSYMQCAGSWQAMTVEVRIQRLDGSHEHYVVAREAVGGSQEWVTITYVSDISFSGATQTREIRLHPQEVFTGQQAVEVFADYVLHATLPPKHLLRPLDV